VPLGSGLSSHWENDARGIPLARVCEKCRDEKLSLPTGGADRLQLRRLRGNRAGLGTFVTAIPWLEQRGAARWQSKPPISRPKADQEAC
jgi:hypothetical protein